MKIPRQDPNLPKDFFIRNEDYAQMLYMASIVRWDQVNYALGE